jgi:hypothetical protein
MQFHNAILASPLSEDKNKYLSIKENLIASLQTGDVSKEELIQLAYIYELEGKYAERDVINKKICTSFNDRCSDSISVEIMGIVKDIRGWAVQNAEVYVLSERGIKPVLSDENGAYRVSMKVNELQKVRLKITKRGYSDAIVNVTILTKSKKRYHVEDAIINSANNIFTVDTIKKTITGGDNQIINNSAIINTPQSTYTIPLNIFFDKNGKVFSGQVEAFVYEFTRDTVPMSIMSVDTFDTVRGYAGNLMQTFGMPYIQFFDKDGNVLYVKKSLPIKLVYRMYHMGDLYSGSTNIYEPVTERDVEEMIHFSKNSKEEYPITRQFLIDSQLLKFPAWWIFDQSKGVWDNMGYKLVDSSGTIETIFYTIKDVI